MEVLCLGAANMDIFASPVDQRVFQIQKQHVKEIGLVPGGDAVNQAITLSKFGVKAGLAACIGADDMGALLSGRLQKAGVDLSCLRVKEEEKTTVALVLIGENGERNIVAMAGAHGKMKKEDVALPENPPLRALSIGSFFSCPDLEDDGLEELLKSAKAKGILTFADMSSDKRGLGFAGIARFLPEIDYFIPSLYEAEHLTGKREKAEMAQFFLAAGAKHVLIKCGEDGCYYHDGSISGMVPTVPIRPIDTTGAGDCFVASFIFRTLRGDALFEAIAFSCAAATLHTQYRGASASPLSEGAVREFRERYA